MLCSISTGKSSSEWLNRLRSSRGLPAGPDVDLDHFLATHNPNLSNPTSGSPIEPNSTSGSPQPDSHRTGAAAAEESSAGNGDEDWFGIMSNVLSELFIMGDSNCVPKLPTKKGSRKQVNPRIRVVPCKSSSVDERHSSDLVRRDVEDCLTAVPLSSGDSLEETNGDNGRMGIRGQDRAGGCGVDAEEEVAQEKEEEGCGDDLKGFSRSEVTIIDTSCRSWKSDKWLFRRKNEWRVGEKKFRWKNVGRKKREVSSFDESDGGGKKPKVMVTPIRRSKGPQSEESLALPQERRTQQDDGKGTHQSRVATQISRRRYPFSRFPRKVKVECSPLDLTKDVPSCKQT